VAGLHEAVRQLVDQRFGAAGGRPTRRHGDPVTQQPLSSSDPSHSPIGYYPWANITNSDDP
jgi:hypothetical protein